MDINLLPQIMVTLPEIWLASVLLLLVAVGPFLPTKHALAICTKLLQMSLLITVGFISWQALPLGGEATAWPRLPDGMGDFVRINSFTQILKVIILLASVAALAIAPGFWLRGRDNRFEYPLLVGLSVLGMLILISSYDFLTLYIGLELMSFPLYILCAYKRDDARSSEAGLKYFVLGALASGVLLYGVALLYGLSGGTGYDQVGHAVMELAAGHGHPVLALALVLVLCSMAFKLSAVPFHLWTPDVYSGAPTPVTAFLATVPKMAAFALLVIMLTGPLAALVKSWSPILWLLSLLSMGLGSLLALRQKQLKRLLAYSSIAHVGFMLTAVLANSPQGLAAVVFYLMIYALMTLGVFAGLLSFQRQEREVEQVSDLAGLSQQQPAQAALLGLCLFSLAGVPPLAGFFAKFFAFQATIAAGYFALAIIGVLLSVVAAYYSLMLVKTMYFDPPGEPITHRNVGSAKRLLWVGGVATLLFGILPTLLYTVAQRAVVGIF